MITIDDLAERANELVTRAEIAATAYELWEKAGCPVDQADKHWREAEAIVKDSAAIFVAQATLSYFASRDGLCRQIMPPIPMKESETKQEVLDSPTTIRGE